MMGALVRASDVRMTSSTAGTAQISVTDARRPRTVAHTQRPATAADARHARTAAGALRVIR
ncbi:hypothetical protein OSC27_09970 [Microbacterium sp. STN6]|uniref:hypothetical protein n=1 Tax=Microbacterium sp. STN6 TaxID=2995588 RepID=UPI002260F5E7|nr:hypothetical protein [Microbacterium sp. STN6]MCX7522600.1 hypothetical protein [Microbacterium sp. STN6]